jgi:hypothetical protein
MIKPNIVGTYLGTGLREESFVEFQHGKLCRVEDLVAELAIPFYPKNFEIDITTL